MVLEGLAALGVARNIVQFMNSGCRLVSQSQELYMSFNGLADETVELENIAQSLGRLTSDLVVEHSFQNQPSSDDP